MYHAKPDGGATCSVPQMVRYCFSVPYFMFYGTLRGLWIFYETQISCSPIKEFEQVNAV